MKYEYRVIWQREGWKKKSKLYQTKQGASHYVHILTSPWPDEAPNLPPIIYGPIIEMREIGNWKSETQIKEEIENEKLMKRLKEIYES